MKVNRAVVKRRLGAPRRRFGGARKRRDPLATENRERFLSGLRMTFLLWSKILAGQPAVVCYHWLHAAKTAAHDDHACAADLSGMPCVGDA